MGYLQIHSWKAPEFDPNQIRALVFIENGLDSRRLIFDSKSIKRVKEDEGKKCCINRLHAAKAGCQTPPSKRTGNPGDTPSNAQSPGYQITRRSGDVTMLEEMVYGSLPMSSKGTTVKVHVIRQPAELMLSKVFPVGTQRESQIEQDNSERDDVSLSSTVSDFATPQTIKNNKSEDSAAHSLPMEMPSSPLKYYRSSDDDDSGIVRSASTSSFATPYPSPGTSVSSNNSNSVHRRWLRHQVTAIDFRRRSVDASSSSLSGEESSLRGGHRKQKIGLSIIISLCSDKDNTRNKQFQSFFFSHFPLFEHHFYKLGINIEKSVQQKQQYIQAILQALDVFRNGIFMLYTAPRIQEPVWLNMMVYYNQHGQLANRFLQQFVVAVDQYDSKNSNFFVSRLLTAVLTYHLAWVPTVTPSGAPPSQVYSSKHSSNTLNLLAKSHPYNPLWAQLGDLYGALSYPMRTVKTVVVGKKSEVVCRLLYILSYFIRCSEVHENIEKRKVIREDDMLGRETPILEDSLDFEGSEFVLVSCDTEQSKQENSSHRNKSQSSKESTNNPHSTNSEDIGNQGERLSSHGNSCCQGDEDVNSNSVLLQDNQMSVEKLENERRELDSPQERTVGVETNNLSDQNLTDPVVDLDMGNVMCKEQKVDEIMSNSDLVDTSAVTCDTSQEEQEGSPVNYNLAQSDCKTTCHFKEAHVSCTEHKTEQLICVGRAAVDTQQSTISENVVKYDKLGSEELSDRTHCSNEDLGTDSDISNLKATICNNVTDVRVPVASRAYMRLGSTEGSCSLFDEYFSEEFQEENLEGISEKEDKEIYQVQEKRRGCDLEESDAWYPNTDRTVLQSNCENENKENITERDALNEIDLTERTELKDGKHEQMRRESTEEAKTLTLCLCNKSDKCTCSTHSDSEPATPTADIPCHEPGTPTEFTHGKENAPNLQNVLETPTTHHIIARPRTLDFNTQRHPVLRMTSNTSTTSSVDFDPFGNPEELPLPGTETMMPSVENQARFECNFGRSLLGGYSSKYLPDFALHGTRTIDRNEVLEELKLSVQNSVLDEPIAEAVCIVADTDTWKVELLSSQMSKPVTPEKSKDSEISSSTIVHDILKSVSNLWDLKMSSEFCVMHLEDKLQEIYFKSKALAEYLRVNRNASAKELLSILDVNPNDLKLLLGVTSVHSPWANNSLVNMP
ncbi:folliculin-interacting protein 1-like isoform X2 [Glandiceps talaboti]